MELKLYRCAHCGNIAFKVVDKGVPLFCCGEKMEELAPNTNDGAMEKHVPVVEKSAHGHGYSVTVKVGEVEHPMLPEHYIPLIAAVSGSGILYRRDIVAFAYPIGEDGICRWRNVFQRKEVIEKRLF